MKSQDKIKPYIIDTFKSKYVDSIIKYYTEAISKHQIGDWEGVSVKGGKFVESVTKALMTFCRLTIPTQRTFKAGNSLRNLEQLPSSDFDADIRIVIPKACLLIYEIANNRGGRHDADDINPNIMDAEIILPTMSWILAEMIRFSNQVNAPEQAKEMIQSLSKKTYTHFENIDGRLYVNIDGLDARSIALLLLYNAYPKRIGRKKLADFVKRHGFTINAAKVAVHRIMSLVDVGDEGLKLRGIGMRHVETLLSKKIT